MDRFPWDFFQTLDCQVSLHDGIKKAVYRELKEETGINQQDVLKIEIPEPATLWQDPTCMTNGTYVAFVQVNTSSFTVSQQHTHIDGEDIRKVEFLSVSEILKRTAQGRTSDGVVHHMGISLAPLMIFFARHPECFTSKV